MVNVTGPAVTLKVTPDTIEESNSAGTGETATNVATVTATIAQASTAATTITVRAEPVAPADSDDYTVTSNKVLTIAAGSTTSTGTVTVTAVNDSTFSPDRKIDINATVANTAGASLGNVTRLTITEDDAPPDRVLRLVDGETSNEGRLEIYLNSSWGTICDDYWTGGDAEVACRQLGYEGGEGNVERYLRGYFPEGTGPIHLDDMQCRGRESSLLDCTHTRTHNCKHSEDVGVRCSETSARITGTPSLSAPGDDGEWTQDEQIEVSISTTQAIAVNTAQGTPSVRVLLGDSTERTAAYAGGSGTKTLVFRYTLVSGDGSHARVGLVADSLVLNGGHLRSVLTGRDLILDHGGASRAGTPSDAPALTASFESLPTRHAGPGRNFTFELRFSADIKMSYVTVRDDLLVTRAHIHRAQRIVRGSNQRWMITASAHSLDDVVITLPATTDCTSPVAVCTHDEKKLSEGVSVTIPGEISASIRDAEAHEAPGAELAFVVTLNRPAGKHDMLRYSTFNGTARAGEDYVAQSGFLVFEEGWTARTIAVPVLDDAIDEAEETMRVEIYPVPNGGRVQVRIADGTEIGTIINHDPMPKAWLARFGRGIAEQVTDAVETRVANAPSTGVRLEVGGYSIDPSRGVLGALEALTGGDERSDERADAARTRERTIDIDARALARGTTFSLTGRAGNGGYASLWGEGALSRLDTRTEALRIDGEIASTLLGADFTRGRGTLGALVAISTGEGDYRTEQSRGAMESTLTGLYPYARYRLDERLSVWGVVGYGEGELTLRGDGHAPIDADIDLAMAGGGVRSELRGRDDEGPTLAIATDGFAVRSSSDAVPGLLAASSARATRLRVALEAGWPFNVGTGELTPELEVGIRHDGGDAETGLGADVGGGLRLAAPEAGLEAHVRARALLAHEAEGVHEHGFAGGLTWDPRPGSERGPSLSISHRLGAPASGGVDALLERDTLEELGDTDEETLRRQRVRAELGYGFALPWSARWTLVPRLGVEGSGARRTLELGWRIGEEHPGTYTVYADARARRSARDSGDEEPERSVELALGWRARESEGASVDVETTLGTRTRSDSDELRIGVDVHARW